MTKKESTKKKSVELLSPAGTINSMRHAFAFGADAVYAGTPRYSLRVRNNDFHDERLEKGIAYAHELGKKFYLTTNILPHNNKVNSFIRDLEPIISLKPDALIMADPGLIMLVKERFPDIEIHLSVQANTMNYAAAKFWHKVGISRVILSRELSLKEIAEIKQKCPEMEIEVFVHGALCIAYSGRCLLSGYFNQRDPNQGTCTNACRWKYKLSEAHENTEGVFSKTDENLNSSMPSQGERHSKSQEVYFLEEKERPGETMEISEDEHGTYIMNSKDLRAIEHVKELINVGVDSLKIEGRTKSHYYVARTAQIYKGAINDAIEGKPFDPKYIGKLENLANRGYTDGFYVRHHTKDYQNYLDNTSKNFNQKFVGEVINYDDETGLSEIEVKNKLSVGDTIEVISPEHNYDFHITKMENNKKEPMQVAPGSGHIIFIDIGKVTLPTLLAVYTS